MDALNGSPYRIDHTGWAVRWHPAPGARLRLLCLPHAGGGAGIYRRWAADLAPAIEVISIRLPGRETRHRETPFVRIDDLVPAMLRGVESMLDRPYAWFGHSMGALIAFEACRASRRLGLPEPQRLLVSGEPAPHLIPRGRSLPAVGDADLMDRLRELAGTPPELLDTAALASILPVLRADYAVTETYRYHPEAPLQYPISVFGGADDTLTDAAELDAWRQHSSVECIVRILNGRHFFLHDDWPQLLPALRADLLTPSGRLN